MKRLLLTAFLVMVGLSITYSQSLQYFELGDHTLESGEILYNATLGYRTFGELNHDSSNVVLMTTWFGGTSEMLSSLIGPDRFIDDSHFFVITVDALGNGVSSSPSNSQEQPDSEFPVITIGDMIATQYRLLNEHFGLNGIYGAVGGSMGGMQIFEWLVQYPGYIDRAVPYVATPRLSTSDLMHLFYIRKLIETGVRNGVPEREIMTLLNIHSDLMGKTPDYFHTNFSIDDVWSYFNELDDSSPGWGSLNDYLVQLNAIIAHDISRTFDGSMEQVAGIINASVLIIIAANDQIVHPAPSLSFAEQIQSGITVLENECGHLTLRCEMDTVSSLIQAFLAQE